MNCWQFKSCEWIEDCPAYPDHGDCCMVTRGTLCCDSTEVVAKLESCKKCSFFASEHYNHKRAHDEFDELY